VGRADTAAAVAAALIPLGVQTTMSVVSVGISLPPPVPPPTPPSPPPPFAPSLPPSAKHMLLYGLIGAGAGLICSAALACLWRRRRKKLSGQTQFGGFNSPSRGRAVGGGVRARPSTGSLLTPGRTFAIDDDADRWLNLDVEAAAGGFSGGLGGLAAPAFGLGTPTLTRQSSGLGARRPPERIPSLTRQSSGARRPSDSRASELIPSMERTPSYRESRGAGPAMERTPSYRESRGAGPAMERTPSYRESRGAGPAMERTPSYRESRGAGQSPTMERSSSFRDSGGSELSPTTRIASFRAGSGSGPTMERIPSSRAGGGSEQSPVVERIPFSRSGSGAGQSHYKNPMFGTEAGSGGDGERLFGEGYVPSDGGAARGRPKEKRGFGGRWARDKGGHRE